MSRRRGRGGPSARKRGHMMGTRPEQLGVAGRGRAKQGVVGVGAARGGSSQIIKGLTSRVKEVEVYPPDVGSNGRAVAGQGADLRLACDSGSCHLGTVTQSSSNVDRGFLCARHSLGAGRGQA